MTESPSSELVLYQTEDGRTRIQCRFEDETIWLPQALIAELFQKDVRTINEHLVNIYDEGELTREATIRKFRIVRTEGNRSGSREIEHYRLEAILAVGFRVRSHRGTQFRQWALEQDALRRPWPYRRRDHPRAGRCHQAVHGYADSAVLLRIVSLYIDYAELQALERHPMTMRAWLGKLDEFLKTAGRPLLDHAGTVSAERPLSRARRCPAAGDRHGVRKGRQSAQIPAPEGTADQEEPLSLSSTRHPKPPTRTDSANRIVDDLGLADQNK